MMKLYSPLAQFDVASLYGVADCFFQQNIVVGIIRWLNLDAPYDYIVGVFFDISYYVTNFSLTLMLVFFLIYWYTLVVGILNFLIPRKYNFISDSIFLFIYDMVQSKIGPEGLKFFPFIFSMFFYILTLNFLSLMPYSFAVTTHIIWVLCFTLSILSGLLFLGIWRHGFKFVNMFIPEVPKFLYPLIIPLEMLSYVIRGFSLAIRLSANVLAGHTLTHIISDTVKLLGLINFDLAVVSLILLIGITVMEMGVACLQAYIFTLLIVIYINDVYNLSH